MIAEAVAAVAAPALLVGEDGVDTLEDVLLPQAVSTKANRTEAMTMGKYALRVGTDTTIYQDTPFLLEVYKGQAPTAINRQTEND